MGVVSSQTVEDGEPRRPPHATLHHEGTAAEYIRVELGIRLPWRLHPSTRLVIRAHQATAEITASLEAVRIE